MNTSIAPVKNRSSAEIPSVPGLGTIVPELDGVRGLAVLSVVFYHLGVLGGFGKELPYTLPISLGWSGVDLFFVLSGLLITGILIDSKNEAQYFLKFYARRVLRIFPLYYLVVGAVLVGAPAVLHLIFPNASISPGFYAGSHLYAWTFTVNIPFSFGRFTSLLNHLWSIAIEEHFYLVWPFAVFRFSAVGLRRLCCALILMAPIGRVLMVWMGYPGAAYALTPFRTDALALGGFLAILLRERPDFVRGGAKPTCALTGICVAAMFLWRRTTYWGDPVVVTLGLSLLPLLYVSAMGVLLHQASGSGLRRMIRVPLLRRIGKYSYAIYLFHQPIIVILGYVHVSAEVFRMRLGSAIAGDLAFAVLVLGTTVGAAAVSWTLVEKRFLAFKDHFSYVTKPA